MNGLIHLIHGADLWIYGWFSGLAGNWVLDRLASQEEANNIFKGGLFLAILWYLWFRPGAEQKRGRTSVIAVLLGAPAALIVARTVSFLAPYRVRPIYDAALAHPVYSIHFYLNLENWSAFPSDTAAFFFALAFGIALLSRRLAVPIMLYTAVWICLPRLYLGIHFASDMVVGTAIGIVTAWVLLRTGWVHSLSGRVLGFAEKRPEWFYPVAFLVSFEFADLFRDVRNVGRAALHLARIRSYSYYVDAAIGIAIVAVYLLIVVGRKLYLSRVKARSDYTPREQSAGRPPGAIHGLR